MNTQRKLDAGGPAPCPAAVVEKRDRLISTAQLARILNVSPRQARYLIAQGHFRALRVGKRTIRVIESSIRDYLIRQADLYDLENGGQDESL